MGMRRKKNQAHIETRNGNTRIRWTHEGKRYSESWSTQERYEEITYLLKIGKNPRGESEKVEGIDKERITCEILLDWWIELKASEVQQTSINIYGDIHKTALKGMPEYHPVQNCREIVRYVKKNLTVSVGKRFLRNLNAACREYLDCTPYGKDLKTFREKWQDNPEPRALTQDEIAHALASLPSEHTLTVQLALLTGMRPAELYGLQWRDVKVSSTGKNSNGNSNGIQGVIHIQRQCREVTGGIEVKDGLKTQSSRKFPVSSELKRLLEQLDDRWMNIKCLLPESEDWILIKDDGSKGRYLTLYHHWKKCMPKGTTPYNCRDSFITDQLIKGTPASVVATWVGNSTQVIEKHYLDQLSMLQYCPK